LGPPREPYHARDDRGKAVYALPAAAW
jgi:hypothetical protein